MSAFVLKIIAIITMFIDHFGYVISNGHFSYYNYIGRISFPIFAFQISEGYIHTKNLKKYFFRILGFAILSQIPFTLFNLAFSHKFSLNVFFTLFLGLTSILIYDKSKNKFLGIIASILLGIVSQICHCDYGFYGVAIIVLFYIFKNNKALSTLFFIIATLVKYSILYIKNNYYKGYIFLFLCTCIPIIFINLYNGKKGKNIKYFLYIFYPAHLLLLYFLYIFLKAKGL